VTTDAKTIDERYTRAMQSDDLTDKSARVRVDLDYLIAAGYVHDGLGTALYRLAAEWDMASGDFRLARTYVRRLEHEAEQLKRNAHKEPEQSARLLAEANHRLRDARNSALTAKAMALVHLKTLHDARQWLGRFAQQQALRKHFHRPNLEVRVLAGQALNLWLDSTCQSCQGLGFTGGFNGPKVLCTDCGASGKAHWGLRETVKRGARPEDRFVLHLLAQMDMKVHRVDQRMKAALRRGE
jgi:hypothetical protein